ncbi:helix-turn-helix protein [Kineothrix alysoides]|uniref:Helix-turn-helix protein n=1 Tax=Kineothrix alysoides TaxID=1469948 RepID=A0A4R1QWE6_9FIRM|nr:helix-turn-helix domain-containing protein [Kineothrix alysoides]TCL57641.1 helix-turn-helix protein [Kineothrix alysoides]
MNQFEMKQKAYQSNLKSRALQVLLYLIDRSNKEKTCFPAVPTISRELHISISTVKRAMRELVDAGYVQKESRFREGNRGQTSNLYILFFQEVKKSEDCGNEMKSVRASDNVEQKHMVYVELNATEKPLIEIEVEFISEEAQDRVYEKIDETEAEEEVSERAMAEGTTKIEKMEQRNILKVRKDRNMWIFLIKRYSNFLESLVYYFEKYCTLCPVWTGEEVNLIPP